MKNLILLPLLILSVLKVFAQQNPESSVPEFLKNNPQEKVFLQTDKNSYIAGETIWMKAWCTLDGTPSQLSRVLYVDLVDKKGRVTLKKMYSLDSLASTAADFELPPDVPTGTYSLNSYTLWMKNFAQFVYKKNITIYGTDYTDAKQSANKDALSLKFFPEGGTLIAGITNRVAFKATDGFNMPFSFAGNIQDKNGKKVSDITSAHDGMGTFEFIPENGNSYTAYVQRGSQSTATFKLPEAQNEGVNLRVENSNPNKIFVMINRAENNKAKFGKVKLVAQINYTVIFKALMDLDQGQMATAINKKDLPGGILHLTLFNDADLPIAERLVFIENYTIQKPEIHFGAKDFNAKGLNKMNIAVPGVTNKSSLSFLVASFLPGVSEDYSMNESIASSILLTSDLVGYIHNPGYYFKDKTPEILKNLDLLLLTHGWRRFEWREIVKTGTPAQIKYPIESFITVRGNILKSDKSPVNDGFLSFIVKGADSSKSIGQVDVTKSGDFAISDLHFKKEANLYYMGTDKSKSSKVVNVKILPNYIDSLKTSGLVPSIVSDTLKLAERTDLFAKGDIDKLSTEKIKMLENVTVSGKKLRPEDKLNQEYATGPFRALQGNLIDASQFREGKTIWQIIQQSVPGIQVEPNPENPLDPYVSFGRFSAMPQSSNTGELENGAVIEQRGIAYFLNEMNVNKEVINNMIVEDIALIKVLKNEAAALGASQGAIAIYTKSGVDAGRAVFEKGYDLQKLTGYAIVKKFYEPDFVYDPSKKNYQDNRQILYWNNNVSTSAKKHEIQFYNNDFGKKYQVLIQGIDKNGNLIYTHQIID